MKRSLTVLFSLVLAATAHAQNWPSFRGPDATGIADRQNLPVKFSAEDGRNILWKTAIPGLAHSSPVVWGDRVYITTAVNTSSNKLKFCTGECDTDGGPVRDEAVKHSWRLYSLDKRTGKILWSRIAHEGIPRVTRHRKGSHASATPVTDGKRIVALFSSEGLFCFDMDGKLLWRKDLGLLDQGYWNQPELQWSPASSPVIYENLVIVQNDRQKDSFLAAFDLRTGKEVWRAERNEKPAWSTPVVYRGDRNEVITNSSNYFYGYNPATGEEFWRFSNEGRVIIGSSPVVAEDLVVLTGSYPPGPTHAIRLGGSGDLSPGKENSSGSQVAWKISSGSPYVTTPLIYRGIVYVLGDNGVLRAYDLRTGERFYQTRIAVGAGFSASPVASDGKIYFSSEDGEVYVVKAGRKYELLSTNTIGEVLMATPAISGGRLIIRGRNHLYAIGSR